MTTKRYAITEAISSLAAPIEVEMERCEQTGETADEAAPLRKVMKMSLFEVGRLFGIAIRERSTDEAPNATLSLRDLQRLSDAIAINHLGWRYRAPLPLIGELIIDSNAAANDAKKKQPNTPSSVTMDSPSPTKLKKSPRRKKNSKS